MAMPKRSSSIRVAEWFLFLSYLIGGPVMLYLELTNHLISERFGYSAAFVYLIGSAQVVCALLLRLVRLRLFSLAALTLISIGAIASHLLIGSPLTGLPALAYTALQLWLAARFWRPPAGEAND